MDLLNVDLKSLIPYVTDAYAYVYGEEYREIILRRLRKMIVINYININELISYFLKLKEEKCKLLALDFLTLIGENVKYEDNLGKLDKQTLEVLINMYLGNPVDAFYIFSISYADENVPIRSFYKDNIGKDSDILLNNKLRIINYLRNKPNDLITLDNYNEFIKTDEYKCLLNKIENYIDIYEKLLLEYKEWRNNFKDFNNYLEKEWLKDLSVIEQNEEVLKKSKKCIYRKIIKQFKYLEEYICKKDINEGIDSIMYFIESQICKSKIEISFHHKYSTSCSYHLTIMLFSILSEGFGILSFMFLHECGHIIENDEDGRGSGFEYIEDYFNDAPRNPYNINYRKYEKFNETINDIFTEKANEYLHDNDIYLLEDKEFVLKNTSNINSSIFSKRILYPLVEKFKKQVVLAKIYVDRDKLTNFIGINNFEELVDTVNKIEYLVEKGLAKKINNDINSPIVVEYYNILEKVKKIYDNVDRFYSEKFARPHNKVKIKKKSGEFVE